MHLSIRTPIRHGGALVCACALTLATTLATFTDPAAAAMYKWTDANGRVVYSDQPPPASVKSELLNPTPPPANPNAVKEMAQGGADLSKRQSERAEADAKAAKARTDAERIREACARVRAQIAQLSADNELLRRVNEKGEKVYMDDAMRRKEREPLEKWSKENCAN